MDFTDSESQSEQNDVPVPNVVGKLEKDASSTLSAAGFKVSKTYKYDDSVDAGKVVSQSPRGGNAQEGSTVTIVISQERSLVRCHLFRVTPRKMHRRLCRRLA